MPETCLAVSFASSKSFFIFSFVLILMYFAVLVAMQSNRLLQIAFRWKKQREI